ncbi:hypothetical protein FMUND_3941 [Fusarium mundagurra]|uniref:Uncharacterized protein n=1 Tax=Fusarium mundagurra TaxID=1567541 RepID=A0A8H6DKK8_9HYPO|nr:hypothetical protein FMUND_3941 [Fusarium mundagurra]
MDLQNLDAAVIYIICENFCLHCHEGHGDGEDFPSVSAARDADAKTLRYTLVSLSTVCRSWGYIAQKTLHHHFGFYELSPEAMIPFCRTLYEKPELAKLVKQARLTHIFSTNIVIKEDWLFKCLDKISNILGFHGRTFGPKTFKWEQFIGAALLLRLPNREFLMAEASDLHELLNKFRKPLSLLGSKFPQLLKSVEVGNRHPKAPTIRNPLDLSRNTIGGFMSQLPNLQCMELRNPSFSTLQDPLRLGNMRHVCLLGVDLGWEGLKVFISATGPLESFQYQGSQHGPDPCSIQDVCHALAIRKNTLKWLRVLAPFQPHEFTAGRRLTNVTYMRMMLESIFYPMHEESIADDQLIQSFVPPSLETIQLDVGDHTLGRMLDAIISYIQSSYRKDPKDQILKSVEIHVMMYSDRETMEHSPKSIHNSAWRLIKRKCRRFLENGNINLQATWYGTRREAR